MQHSFLIDNHDNISIIKKKDNKEEYLKKLEYRNKLSYFLISLTFGITYLSDLAVQFFLKDILGVEPAHMSQIMSLTQIPWFLKPFFGLMSDTCPLFGFRRKLYLIICGLISFSCWISISLIKEDLYIFASLLFLNSCCLSCITVLGEAIVVELSQLPTEEEDTEMPNSASDFQKKSSKAKNYVSYFLFFKYLGSLFSSLFKGILVQMMPLRTIFFMTSFIPLIFVISGMILMEIPVEHNNQASSISTAEHPNIEVVRVQEDDSCVTKFFGFLCQRHIIVPIIFTIVFVGTPSYSDPMFFFLSNHLNLQPMDMGVISLFSTLAILVGIVLYRFYFKKMKFKNIIIYGTFTAFLVSFSAFLLVQGYNRKLGIPDFPFIIFSYSFISMLGELIAMPLLSLAAVLSPKNLEGTAYSVFMSAINFGVIISNLLGSFLTSWLGITKNDYSKLPDLILMANFMSLLPLPFLFCMNKSYFDPEIKNLNENEEKLVNNRIDGTGGN